MLLPLAIGTVASRLLGLLALAFGLLVVRYNQRIGIGLASAIIRPPDIITDRQPPDERLRESGVFIGRGIGAFLVLWGAGFVVAGGAALLGVGHWG